MYPDKHEQLNWLFGSKTHEPPLWQGLLLQVVTSVQFGGEPNQNKINILESQTTYKHIIKPSVFRK